MAICPVPRKVDGKGLADLEPGFLSWWEGWGRKGSNRVGRGENGGSSCTSLPPLHELSRIQFLAVAWGTQAGLEASPAQHPLLAALSGDLWWSPHLPISAHLLAFPSTLRGLAFLSGSPERGTTAALTLFEMQNWAPCPPILMIQGAHSEFLPSSDTGCVPTYSNSRRLELTSTQNWLKIYLYFLNTVFVWS